MADTNDDRQREGNMQVVESGPGIVRSFIHELCAL